MFGEWIEAIRRCRQTTQDRVLRGFIEVRRFVVSRIPCLLRAFAWPLSLGDHLYQCPPDLGGFEKSHSMEFRTQISHSSIQQSTTRIQDSPEFRGRNRYVLSLVIKENL